MPWLTQAKMVVRDLLLSRHWPRRPEHLVFEITAACDARCIHCPRLDMDRPMKPMAMDLFRRLIDQADQLGVPYLVPAGYGEICTIPVQVLEEYLAYISSKAHRFKILIPTNGHRMTEERSALFIKHAVHLVNVSIDGATAATAEAIRRNLSFDRIEANIKQLLAMRNAAGKKYPRVRVGMVEMPQTIPEMEPFLERWQGVADFAGPSRFTSRLGSVSAAVAGATIIQLGAPSEPERPSSACVLPFSQMAIWADGKAVPCCDDWNEEFVVGDLNTQTLDEIWHGPKMADVRKKHIARAGHDISLCAKCTCWRPPSLGARLWC
jgi:radical SAM protein with 4Fe4S-binding SPASM domain